MRLKRAIIVLVGLVLFIGLCLSIALYGSGNVSEVRIGFSRYEVVDGKHSLILVVTNGSSYPIMQPERWELRGESPGGSIRGGAGGTMTTSCGIGSSTWDWGQFQLPKIASIAPGENFQFTIPVTEGPYTWHVTVPLETIPFKDRLPYILRSRWPSSKRDTPIAFNVSSQPIPPPSSRVPADHSATGTSIKGNDKAL